MVQNVNKHQNVDAGLHFPASKCRLSHVGMHCKSKMSEKDHLVMRQTATEYGGREGPSRSETDGDGVWWPRRTVAVRDRRRRSMVAEKERRGQRQTATEYGGREGPSRSETDGE